MDLHLYLRVIWRFRLLVLSGLLLACALAFLSYAKVSFAGGKPQIHYRQQETWSSSAIVGLEGARFLEGQSFPIVDPTRFAAYAFEYATLANGDEVRSIVFKMGRPLGDVVAAPYISQTVQGAPFLPFIQFTGLAADPGSARVMAHRGIAAFTQWLASEQIAAATPIDRRVRLTVLNRPAGPKLVQHRRLTTPVVIFLTLMIAALGLAFILENLRPRVQPVRTLSDENEQQIRSRSA